ncbi:hypothetical protein SAMN05444141_101636 [Pseudovibrio denitrificans]|uniref:Flagellar FliJ protein n=1 Tax=Pseudovibrio denitrificans TaxID=258256 RepID=A0A1I6Y4T4_9HYPH|nr:hypothetical protein [Pseudovibrio denitrificans]SFT45372.1 hypothetical protein SAMN05444141_101636 [Pseudovibrio denitrificans]
MDKARVTRLRRIMKVQEQKEQMIKYDIAVLDNEIQRCDEEEGKLVSHWGQHEGELREVMNRAISRRLDANNRSKSLKQKQKNELLEKLLDQKRQTNMTEKHHDKALVSYHRTEEKKLLQEIAELHADTSKVRSR